MIRKDLEPYHEQGIKPIETILTKDDEGNYVRNIDKIYTTKK